MTLDIAHQLIKSNTFVIDTMRHPAIQCTLFSSCLDCEYATRLTGDSNCFDCYAFRLDITNCNELLKSYPEFAV